MGIRSLLYLLCLHNVYIYIYTGIPKFPPLHSHLIVGLDSALRFPDFFVDGAPGARTLAGIGLADLVLVASVYYVLLLSYLVFVLRLLALGTLLVKSSKESLRLVKLDVINIPLLVAVLLKVGGKSSRVGFMLGLAFNAVAGTESR
ncbi:hypothetical protein BDU57DRAFT_31521 [Ampelomyces quisqualis]|uniref:Uncharacterized protein n=1 Tax=Ampelomyces quisqualis TaxID=50730 RepID=A0A6A5R2G1_AMPQU|nr:hypothetical protein BDU57DRAFT_31521 [Ampelomyces quisqualis]